MPYHEYREISIEYSYPQTSPQHRKILSVELFVFTETIAKLGNSQAGIV